MTKKTDKTGISNHLQHGVTYSSVPPCYTSNP